MAYFIDETRNTAVKFEGKTAFSWNVETRRFDLPTTDVAPKSRMTRSSEFDARRFLFLNHPQGYVERLGNLMKNVVTNHELVPPRDLTAEIAEAHLKEAKDLVHRHANEIMELQDAVIAYGMQMSVEGRCLSKCAEILKANLFVAENEIEIVKTKNELLRCEHGSCTDCEMKQSCEAHKRMQKAGIV